LQSNDIPPYLNKTTTTRLIAFYPGKPGLVSTRKTLPVIMGIFNLLQCTTSSYLIVGLKREIPNHLDWHYCDPSQIVPVLDQPVWNMAHIGQRRSTTTTKI